MAVPAAGEGEGWRNITRTLARKILDFAVDVAIYVITIAIALFLATMDTWDHIRGNPKWPNNEKKWPYR